MAKKESIEKLIEKELKDLPEDFIVAVITDSGKRLAVNIAIIKYLTGKKKMPGVYISMNKPYKVIVKQLKRNGIDTKKLFFVDTISGFKGPDRPGNENFVALQSPSSLTELGMIISKACHSKKPKFIMMDSLSIMLMYNSKETTLRFIHYVTTQLRKKAWPGVIFSLGKDMKGDTLESITQFCDKVIRL